MKEEIILACFELEYCGQTCNKIIPATLQYLISSGVKAKLANDSFDFVV